MRLVSDVESEGKCDSESGIACWECPNQTDWGEGGGAGISKNVTDTFSWFGGAPAEFLDV